MVMQKLKGLRMQPIYSLLYNYTYIQKHMSKLLVTLGTTRVRVNLFIFASYVWLSHSGWQGAPIFPASTEVLPVGAWSRSANKGRFRV